MATEQTMTQAMTPQKEKSSSSTPARPQTPNPSNNTLIAPPPEAANTNPNSNVNSERSAVVLALFGPSVGPCVGDFSTTYNRVNGRLYAATKAILFYSNLFGFERRLMLKLSDIELIESYRFTSIRICMVDCEDHVFRKFTDRNAVVSLLQELLQQYQYAEGSVAPTIARSLHLSVDTGGNSLHDDDLLEPLRPHLSSEATPESLDSFPTSRPRSRSVPTLCSASELPIIDDGPGGMSSPPPPRRAHSTIDTASNNHNSAVSKTRLEHTNNTPSKKSTSSVQPPSKTTTEAKVPKDFDMEKAWNKAKTPLDEIALEAMTITNCSLDTFMDMFFSNEASHPIAKYQTKQIGDKEIAFSKWKKRKTSSPQQVHLHPPTFDRSVNFIHPLKNAVGPSQAKTTRQQQFQRFGNLGMCLQNSTVVEGVPAADCFRVEDRWMLERNNSASNNETLKLVVSFRIVFIKRTMFKSIIQKNIRQETKTWFRGYANMMLQALAEGSGPSNNRGTIPQLLDPLPLVNDPTITDPGGAAVDDIAMIETTSRSRFDLFWKMAAVLVIITVAMQMLSLQRAVWSMQSQVAHTHAQNDELITTMQKLLAKKC